MDREERERQRILSLSEESYSEESDSADESVEENHTSERSEGSNTEEEASECDSDDIPLNLLQQEIQQTEIYVSKDGTKWRREPYRQNCRIREENIMRDEPGVRLQYKSAVTESECWSLFFTVEMLQKILTHTNAQIKQKIDACSQITNYPHMKECTLSEFKAFIGLLYLSGLHRSGRENLSFLWAADGTGIEIFRLTMTLKRFHFIQSNLCFDDKSTRIERSILDNLAPIRELFDSLVNNCAKIYIPNDNLTIDEMLVAFRGRCKFKQYIPSKPAKYGLKIISLVDATSFYTINMEIYAGKQPSGPYKVSNKPFDVVDRIVQPVSKSCRNITFDNWFTSYELVLHLLKEHKLTSVGTLRKNKTQIPPKFTNTRAREISSSIFGFQKDITIVSHVPKKNKVVLLMSSLHHDSSIDDSTEERRKPEINTFYNTTKGGVDVVDEMCSSYNVSRNSKKWPKTIFYNMLNIAGINGLVIYKNNNKNNIKRNKFLKTLGLSLISDHLNTRKNIIQLPREMRKRIQCFTTDSSEEAPAKVSGVRRRCQVCPSAKDRKTSHTCTECNKFICSEHITPYCNECSNSLQKDKENYNF